ncbi:Copper transport protein CTR3 [Wickerhamomyces ciferrii]|uniref:Copper transport protein n=1 Tax=Wickerhamomyces ciferrii (strain ATCC 14091 / BCRC 22168 / CBS 111 / JCM 3599 / NBRC 0793 / NRRL Y-1031 F-60-10) TaxID=1206466 RepID=K0KEE5_WICCF|nr:Copper transport protein CTR3 [Wickerhamomyces ciferrii]CCH40617.1 Copper transport protein CTR3 [Wickerhamomyces ciferrii]
MVYFNNDGANYNIEDAFNAVSKMSMGGMGGDSTTSAKAACKISVRQFAGSCIGVFLLVLSAQWLHRVAREYDAAIARRKALQFSSAASSDSSVDNVEKNQTITSETYKPSSDALAFFPENTAFSNFIQPVLYTLSHNWFWDYRKGSTFGSVYPSLVEHLVKSIIFTIQWGQSYIIMLLFMYYNGYIIISCLLGALFGRLIFNYEPITCTTRSDSEQNDRKCCM